MLAIALQAIAAVLIASALLLALTNSNLLFDLPGVLGAWRQRRRRRRRREQLSQQQGELLEVDSEQGDWRSGQD